MFALIAQKGDEPQRSLDLARIAFGCLFLARTTPIVHWLHAPFSADTYPLLGWPTNEWSVALPGLFLPNVVVAALCIIRTAAIVFFTAGFRARIAGIIAAFAGYLVLAQDRFAIITSLHVLFLGTLVLAIATSSRMKLVTLIVASIYFWSGVAKLQSDWLSGYAIEASARAGAFGGGVLGNLISKLTPKTIALGAWTVPALELLIAGLIALDKRRVAVVLALVFHVGVELVVNPDLLGWQMAVLLYAIYPRVNSLNVCLPQAESIAPERRLP